MSSIQAKDPSLKKITVLRRMSLDKLRCSAAPLLGSIFPKDSPFIHLLQNAMNSSRAVVQKPAIVLILPAVQILCVAMALLVELIRKLTGGVSFEKLDSFIAQINQLKSKIQTFSVQKAIKERVRNTLNKQASYEHERSQSEISSEGLRVESVSDCTQTKVEHKQKSCDKHKLLRVTSFACITFVYTQFIFLIFLLSQSQFRLGVAFLLICTSITSYFILQISFIKHSQKDKRVSRRQIMTNKTLEAMNSSRPADSVSKHIQSRSREPENCLEKEKLL